MASIILSAAGTVIGAAVGGPIGAAIGSKIGQAIGSSIDGGLSSKTKFSTRGPRLTDLGVQTSTYGKMIPIIYGSVRIGGNIIWSRPIKETVTTTTSSAGGGGKGGGGRISQSTTTYSYSVSLALGICEGPIDEVLRIWADAKQLDLSHYTVRLYKGDEAQLADSFIQAVDGVEVTPAYRGLAYVVFEDFPLADYGNRIPNFTFEVKHKVLYPDYNGEILEEMIGGMVVIPGAGEFVYDTQVEYKIPGIQSGSSWLQQGDQQIVNMHNPMGKANALLSLDQLENTCPNVEWVSVVVAWYGDDMNAGSCVIKPGVEYQAGAITSPDTWQVAGFNRSTARQIIMIDGAPQYGGTPDDDSILRYLDELNARGYSILFYPIMFMDVSGKPWRGDLTGNRLANYQSCTQYSQREVTTSRETLTLDLPLVFSDQRAKTIADISLFSDWIGRTSYQFDLPTQYCTLEPSDIITVTVSGVAHRMRIISTHRNVTGIIRIKAVAEDISTYDFYTAPGVSSELLIENKHIPATHMELLDIPAFPADDADKGVLRIAGAGLSEGWGGAAVYRSDDNGANYTRLNDLVAPAIMGVVSNALAAGTPTVFDEINTITVILVGSGQLQSVTEIAVLNGANAALIGNEIIQFRTATLIEPGKYILSGLLRGRLGTEWAMNTHIAAERFILLDGRVNSKPMANNMLGLSRKYKAVTFGGTIASAIDQDFTYSGVALKPFSPVSISGERDISGNLTINWIRRTRLGGNWQDNIDVPLNEVSEVYEVDVMDGSNVVRTFNNLDMPTATYTASQQIADFGSLQSNVALNIYQLSGVIGRGCPGIAIV